MKLLLAFIVVISVSHINAQHIDTLKLKEEVSSLKGFRAKKSYLKSMYEKDQLFRGKQTNDSIDFQHLISISYFINLYGYPTKLDFGKYSSVPWLIWIHNKYQAIDRISFPIILKGYFKGEIKEQELRTYYLRGLYNYRKDDEGFKEIPLKELFEICEVSLGNAISIKEILDKKNEIDSFNKLEIITETIWKAENTYKIHDYNGEKIKVEHKGDKFKIIHKANGKTYLLKIFDDNSGEPVELEKIAPNRYKYRHQETDKYYEFYDNKTLFRDELRLIKEYKKVDKRKS